jgi:hypothetical protein
MVAPSGVGDAAGAVSGAPLVGRSGGAVSAGACVAVGTAEAAAVGGAAVAGGGAVAI